MQRIVSLGVSLVLLLVIVLFIGIFAALSGSSTISVPYEPLSVEVLAYQELVEQYAKEYEMEDYVFHYFGSNDAGITRKRNRSHASILIPI